jgi:hypothetical protein
MSRNLADGLSSSHLLCREIGAAPMAKASLTKSEELDGRRRYGRVVARAVELCSLTNSEAADRVKVDRAQFQRWLSGLENAQTWRLHADDLIGPALLAAQAEDTPGATIRNVIELHRKVG